MCQLASQADAFIWPTDAVEGGPPGLVLDLTTFIEAGGEPTEADFLPGLWDHFRWQGRTWGLPAGVDPLVVLYDPAAFEAAGLELPAPGWTWDELSNAARRLTRRKGEQVVRYGFADYGVDGLRSFDEAGISYPESDWSWNDLFLAARRLSGGEDNEHYGLIIWPDRYMISFLRAVGGPLVDESTMPPTFRFNAPGVVAAARQLADLVQDEIAPIPRQAEEYSTQDLFALIWANRIGMWVVPPRAFDQEGFDFHPAPLPQVDRCWGPAASQHYIAADTPHAHACWEWLRFLSEYAPEDPWLPARRSVLTSNVFREQVGEDAQAAYLEALECEKGGRLTRKTSLFTLGAPTPGFKRHWRRSSGRALTRKPR